METAAAFLLVATLVLGSLLLWLHGEVNARPWARRIGTVFMVLSAIFLTLGGVAIASLSGEFNRNIEWSRTFGDYIIAADDQLAAGRVEHVRKQFAGFRDGRLTSTYEGGLFLRELRAATDAMRSSGE